MTLKDMDDAEAMHLIPDTEDRELCGTAGDWATVDPAEVTCRECVNVMIGKGMRMPDSWKGEMRMDDGYPPDSYFIDRAIHQDHADDYNADAEAEEERARDEVYEGERQADETWAAYQREDAERTANDAAYGGAEHG